MVNPGPLWTPGVCCEPCEPVSLLLTDVGATRLGAYWLVDDLDNVTINSFDNVTIDGDTLFPHLTDQGGDTVDGGHSGGATAITTTGSGTYKGNTTIKFGSHATEYVVVRHSGTTMTITPGLDQAISDADTISDISPTPAFGSPEAYYVHASFETDTGVIAFNQGASLASPDNELEVDLSGQSLTLNSVSENMPYPWDAQTHEMQFYICPTHAMGESKIRFSPLQSGVPAGFTNHAEGYYGSVIVDEALKTADTDFEFAVTGEVTFSNIGFYPATVEITHGPTYGDDDDVLVTDCGRRDMFACPWPAMENITDAESVTLTGWDEKLIETEFPYEEWGDDTIWYPTSPGAFGSGIVALDAEPSDKNAIGICGISSFRQQWIYAATYAGDPPMVIDEDWIVYFYGRDIKGYSGLTYDVQLEYVRDTPTANDEYPVPYGRVTLIYEDRRPLVRPSGPGAPTWIDPESAECQMIATTVLNLANAAALGGSWTIEATLEAGAGYTYDECQVRTEDTTISWSHS